MTRRRLAVLALLAALALALWWGMGPGRGGLPGSAVGAVTPLGLTLLVPDGTALDQVQLQAWQDSAAEAGYPMTVSTASQLLRSATPATELALVVPDGLHQRMNDTLLAHLQRLVENGSRLMLVYDAGVADMNGHYHPRQSRLSALAGVRYALYGELGTQMQREQEVWLDADALALLAPPPGKLLRAHSDHPLTRAQPAPLPEEGLAMAGYKYGRLRFPVFATQGPYDGQRLLHGEQDSVLAGTRRVGRGAVLFVNLPLSYLKLRTEALLMHNFIEFFGRHVAQLPQLSPMPQGRGALILNWHLDSNAALPALKTLAALGTFEQGPYSVHLTTGPDVDEEGDGRGMGLAGNAAMQDWVRRLVAQGHELGSHGGWIHNAFGRLVGSQPPALSQALIERNMQALTQASGKPVREYSAPTGNHPAWVTAWLHQQGVKAYYFTGDIGMAPTRSYQDGQRGPPDSWAFPVLAFGSHASFEEANHNDVAEADVGAWLNDVSDFCADNRTTRLLYFHPPGITSYPRAFSNWLAHTKALVQSGRLRWTTMAEQTEFANRRLQAQWQMNSTADGRLQLTAHHARTLDGLSWLLPVERFDEPQVLQGRAQVQREGALWRVTALDTSTLDITLAMRAPAPFDGALARAQRRNPLALRLSAEPEFH